jgi:hypothetical protein
VPVFEPAFAPNGDRYGEAGTAFAPSADRYGEAGTAFAPNGDRYGEAGSHEPEAVSRDDMFGDKAPSAGSSWLPRVAIFGAIVVLVGAGVYLWPSISGSGPATQASTPNESEPLPTAAATPPPVDPVAPLTQPAETQPDPAAKVSGWVSVSAPFDISITRGDEPLPLDDRGRVMLEPGKHRLRFQNTELGYDETRTVQIKLSETTTINLQPQTPLEISSNEPAEVLVDGTRAGDTPYKGRMPFGAHTLTVKTPAGTERQFPIDPTMKPVQLEVDFSKP